MHHQLVDESQMFGEFQSFYYNRNVRDLPRYEKPNFLPAPHLIWYIDSQIPGKGFLIVLRKSNGGTRKLLFLYPLSEKTSGPLPSKVDIVKILQFIMTRYMNLLTLNYPLQYGKGLVT